VEIGTGVLELAPAKVVEVPAGSGHHDALHVGADLHDVLLSAM
jgi:hypothetical protein